MANIQTVKNQVATRTLRPMSPAVAEVRTNINLMVEVMKSCMVKDMHFGIIPGVQKPSLFKAGAEKLMATFRLSANPVVEDLSKDGEIRFRVKVEINAKDGSFVGAGIGECSSQEEKYMWRAAVCQEEFDITDETKRRIKFKKNYGGDIQKILQVRCNPSDLANTILKMAKKRALVDGVLTATGASDLFSQDIEDLPAEYVDSIEKKTNPAESPDKDTVKPSEQAPEKAQDTNAAQNGPDQPESGDRGVNVKLDDLSVGETLSEIELLVKSVKFMEKVGKNGMTYFKCEYADGSECFVSKWGKMKDDVTGALCLFLEVKCEEYNGAKQFKVEKVVVK